MPTTENKIKATAIWNKTKKSHTAEFKVTAFDDPTRSCEEVIGSLEAEYGMPDIIMFDGFTFFHGKDFFDEYAKRADIINAIEDHLPNLEDDVLFKLAKDLLNMDIVDLGAGELGVLREH